MRIDFKYLEDNKYNSVTDYCRVLVKQEDYPKTLNVYRGDMLCLTVDVAKAALLDIQEGKYNGPIFVKYKEPNPMTEKDKQRLALKRQQKALGQTKDSLK